MFFGNVPSHEMILELEKQLTHTRIENWRSQDLFSFQWWLLLAVLVIPWFIWWQKVDKKKLLEIILFGLITLIIASFLDAILSELGLWEYNYYIIPLWPRLISADFAVIPITYMFIYQYFRTWKGFLLAMLIVSTIFAFVGEFLLVWAGIYSLNEWRHFYSWPLYLALGAFAKYLTQWILTHNE